MANMWHKNWGLDVHLGYTDDSPDQFSLVKLTAAQVIALKSTQLIYIPNIEYNNMYSNIMTKERMFQVYSDFLAYDFYKAIIGCEVNPSSINNPKSQYKLSLWIPNDRRYNPKTGKTTSWYTDGMVEYRRPLYGDKNSESTDKDFYILKDYVIDINIGSNTNKKLEITFDSTKRSGNNLIPTVTSTKEPYNSVSCEIIFAVPKISCEPITTYEGEGIVSVTVQLYPTDGSSDYLQINSLDYAVWDSPVLLTRGPSVTFSFVNESGVEQYKSEKYYFTPDRYFGIYLHKSDGSIPTTIPKSGWKQNGWNIKASNGNILYTFEYKNMNVEDGYQYNGNLFYAVRNILESDVKNGKYDNFTIKLYPNYIREEYQVNFRVNEWYENGILVADRCSLPDPSNIIKYGEEDLIIPDFIPILEDETAGLTGGYKTKKRCFYYWAVYIYGENNSRGNLPKGGKYKYNARADMYAIFRPQYSQPTIDFFNVKRCTSSGVISDEGEYLSVHLKAICKDKFKSAILRYKKIGTSSSSSWSSIDITKQVKIVQDNMAFKGLDNEWYDYNDCGISSSDLDEVIFSNYNRSSVSHNRSGKNTVYEYTYYTNPLTITSVKFDKDSKYLIYIEISDTGVNGTTQSLNQQLNNMEYPIDVLKGGHGVAIGKGAVNERMLDVAWPIKARGGLYFGDDDSTITDIFGMLQPIGTIYENEKNINPNDYFGGSWIPYAAGRSRVGYDPTDKDSLTNFNVVGGIGGSKWMQKHVHTGNTGIGKTNMMRVTGRSR